jgi:hypothetical protein
MEQAHIPPTQGVPGGEQTLSQEPQNEGSVSVSTQNAPASTRQVVAAQVQLAPRQLSRLEQMSPQPPQLLLSSSMLTQAVPSLVGHAS